MEKRTRNILLWLICACCLLASGCAKVAQSVTVNEDGSVDTVFMVAGPEGIKKEIEKEFTKMQADDMRPVHDAATGWDGYEAGFHDANLSAFLQHTLSFQNIDKKQYEIKTQPGWLYDAYAFRAFFPGDKNSMSSRNDYNPNDPNRPRYEFTLKLPYASETNNADTVSEDGRTLYWDLAAALSKHGIEADVKVEFRIWNLQHIAITAVVLVALAFLCFRTWRKSPLGEADSANQKNIAVVCGALLVAGIGWCAYSVLQFPTLAMGEAIVSDAEAKKAEQSQRFFSFLPAFGGEVDTSDVKAESKQIPQGKLTYPVVVLENQKAAADINQDIKSFVDKFVEDVAGAQLKGANLTYDVRGNAEDYISIVLNKKRIDKNDKERISYHGLVYNKKNGRRMSLEDFLRLSREDVLQEAKQELYVYDKMETGTIQFKRDEAAWIEDSRPKIPENFFLDDRGNLLLLFPVGYLAKIEKGATCVKFTPYSILKLKRAIGILAK